MKKNILLGIIVIIVLFGRINLKYNIDIDVLILSDSSALVTEVWDVQAIGGRSWCKTVNNLGIEGYHISNYEVYMDGEKLKYVNNWFPNTMFGTKGLYGYKREFNKLKLCFGTNDTKRHKFTIKYKLKDYINTAGDSQVIYKKLIENHTFNNFNINIRSVYYNFDDNMEINGYGFDGEIKVDAGVIRIKGTGRNRFSYVSVLGLLPDNIFDEAGIIRNYNSYDMFLEHANNDYRDFLCKQKIRDYCILIFIIIILLIGLIILGMKLLNKRVKIYNGYGYKNNKKINFEEIKMFRDIPFNKDIYYAYVLIKINRIGYEECNILGAIILKWINEKKITIGHKNNKITFIDLRLRPIFEDELEARLFNMMHEASANGILEVKELHEYANRYSERFLSVFSLIEERIINNLKLNGYIYHRRTKDECRSRYIMDEMIYQDSLKLYGLKKFLDDFSNVNTKEVMDIKLWEEYMIFANLFGIADKVSKQLKYIHPDIEKIDDLDLI